MSKRITAERRDLLLRRARHAFLTQLEIERNQWRSRDQPDAALAVSMDIADFDQVWDELTQLPGED